ncbi:hypothetical protein SEA_ZUKO_90 [Streptomyces phage Zuko]|uniref:Uncharacterized protein n=1 Tax=Streptomyces phage Zuko TaxID=2601695 RepID=A0A5J6D721_9CAUD|nr:hypothetical protein PP630_gp090 [Streptomyces phage Zuko]QEQ93668.1 hypothetical protein SEA_ZUKO_90 [Streptomyces phage Zuko]
MTKNTSHADCFHPATKAARAKCRAAKKANREELSQTLSEIFASYYDNTGEADEIMYGLGRIFGHDAIGINEDISLDEIVARAADLARDL